MNRACLIFLVSISIHLGLPSSGMAQGLFGNSQEKPFKSWFSWGQKSDERIGGLYNGQAYSDYASRQASGQDKSKFWQGFGRPSWMPERDPSQPSALSQMSERSKAAWKRTSDSFGEWRSKTSENFRSANSNFRANASEGWERMTRGLRSPDWSEEFDSSEQPRPPLGNSSNWFTRKQ